MYCKYTIAAVMKAFKNLGFKNLDNTNLNSIILECACLELFYFEFKTVLSWIFQICDGTTNIFEL